MPDVFSNKKKVHILHNIDLSICSSLIFIPFLCLRRIKWLKEGGIFDNNQCLYLKYPLIDFTYLYLPVWLTGHILLRVSR